MTEMWLVRHGQTDWNLANIFQGQSDIPLNETGIKQAQSLALKLAGTPFDALYSSDLSRARQTAEIIAEHIRLPVMIDPRLREIRQGIWEGMSVEEVKQKFSPDFSRDSDYLTTPRAAGAETLAQVITRMLEVANEIHEKHNGQRVLLSSHGLAVAVLYLVANDLPIRDIRQYIPDNGQPLVIEVKATLKLPDFNHPGS
jgi:broad specificity phosphatase PhoE